MKPNFESIGLACEAFRTIPKVVHVQELWRYIDKKSNAFQILITKW